MTYRFLVVDDHPVFRQGLVALIHSDAHYKVVAEVGTGQEALEAVDREDLDLALVDISLKNENGLDLVRTFRAVHPDLPVLIVTMHDEIVYAQRALKAGARGLVMKHESRSVVLNAIKTVLDGHVYVSDQMRQRLVESMYSSQNENDGALVDRLTERELEVLEYLGQGYGAAEIANMLTLSVKTVHTYQDHLKEKLQLNSTSEVRRFAVEWYRAAHR